MNVIRYINLDEVPLEEWISLMNDPKVREHLISFPLFTSELAQNWVREKLIENGKSGCRIQAVVCNDFFAGWCAIQEQDGQYELAIVINDRFWGIGKQIFKDMLVWAKEFGHETVYLHLLETRREYRFLKKIATNVKHSQLLGREFTTYEIQV